MKEIREKYFRLFRFILSRDVVYFSSVSVAGVQNYEHEATITVKAYNESRMCFILKKKQQKNVSNNIDLFIHWTSLHVVVYVVAEKTCLLLLGGGETRACVELEEDDVSVFNDVGPAHLTIFAGSLENEIILSQSESPV